jgi:hypothetical protein
MCFVLAQSKFYMYGGHGISTALRLQGFHLKIRLEGKCLGELNERTY